MQARYLLRRLRHRVRAPSPLLRRSRWWRLLLLLLRVLGGACRWRMRVQVLQVR
jgi:hypothetical protein